jgi:type IV secretion system protein VirD4
MGYRVRIVNPFKILSEVLAPGTAHFKGLDNSVTFYARFNPMAPLDPNASDSFHADLDNLADACFDVGTHAAYREPHWVNSAQDVFAAAAGHLMVNERDASLENLPTLRRLTTSRRLLRAAAIRAQQAKGGLDEVIADGLEPYIKAEADNKSELASILSTLRTQVRWLKPKAVAETLTGSDFSWTDLRHAPTAIFIVLPVKYLKNCGRFFRLMLADCLYALLGEPDGLPVFCIADEMAQLGKLDIITDVLGLGAGLGVQLLSVFQDLNQINDLYGKRAPSFQGSAGVAMYFAPQDYETSEIISKLAGDMTIDVPSESAGEQRDMFGWKTGSQTGSSTGRTYRRALLPQEIRQLAKNRMLVFSDSQPGHFIEAYRKPYWEIEAYKGHYSPDPYHKTKSKGVV